MCLSSSAPDIPTTPAPPPPPIKMAGKAEVKKPGVTRRKGKGLGNPLVSRRTGTGTRI